MVLSRFNHYKYIIIYTEIDKPTVSQSSSINFF